jgi:hypothetical protein
MAGDHAVTGILLVGQGEVGGAVRDEAIELDEAPLIQQEVEPLPRGKLALLVLLGDAGRAPALFGLGLAMMQIVEEVAGGGQARKIRRLGWRAEGREGRKAGKMKR